MGRNKIGLKFEGWQELLTSIDRAAGEAGLKKAVEGALKASKEHVNKKAGAAIAKANLPAAGKYSKGNTKKSLDNNFTVEWSGYTGSMNIGFDFQKSGLVSIFLMYGTPRQPPVAGLQDAFYGAATKREVKEVQAEAVRKFIERNMQ